jgi:hypothetical protein
MSLISIEDHNQVVAGMEAEIERLSAVARAYRNVVAWHGATMAAACVAIRNGNPEIAAQSWLEPVLDAGGLPWEAHTDPQTVFDRYNYHSNTDAEQAANVERFNKNMAEDWVILDKQKGYQYET